MGKGEGPEPRRVQDLALNLTWFGVGVDKENPLSPPSQPPPLKGEGGSGLLTLSQKETSPEGEGFPQS
jgi:hypothetical protein